jgi:hypothetical protein
MVSGTGAVLTDNPDAQRCGDDDDLRRMFRYPSREIVQGSTDRKEPSEKICMGTPT